jgi:F0F1-type ATP synthase epsilon subunit
MLYWETEIMTLKPDIVIVKMQKEKENIEVISSGIMKC